MTKITTVLNGKVIHIERPKLKPKPKKTVKDIQLNETQQIKSILGNPPNWLLKWGISIVLIFITGLLIMSWLIKYPDTVIAQVTFTTQNPPIRVISQNNGRLDKWFVEEQMKVQEGDVLAAFYNDANIKDVVLLEKLLHSLNDIKQKKQRILPNNLKLGELQNSYSTFVEAYRNMSYYNEEENLLAQIESIQSQIAYIKKLNNSELTQLNISEKENQLIKKDWERHQYLYEINACTQVELETKELSFHQHERQLETNRSNITNNEMQIEQLKRQIIELKQGHSDEQFNQVTAIQEHINRLKSEIEQWQSKYLIIAPISGTVSLSEVWAKHQFVTSNVEILTIVPENNSNKIIAKAIMPSDGSGKVEVGMTSIISFSNYPKQEYGTINAKISNIALVPQQDEENIFYQVLLDIPQKLMTNYDKEIKFQQEMQGSAQIITEDRRILERIMDKLMEMIKD